MVYLSLNRGLWRVPLLLSVQSAMRSVCVSLFAWNGILPRTKPKMLAEFPNRLPHCQAASQMPFLFRQMILSSARPWRRIDSPALAP